MIIVYLMVLYFFLLLFSDKDYFKCAVIILLSSMFNILTVDILSLTDPMSYIGERGFLIKLDGITMWALTTVYLVDKLAVKMSILLAFSVFFHGMLIYHLTTQSSFVSFLVYAWYDELIITIGIAQMVIASDGINSALRNIRGHLLGFNFHFWRINANHHILNRSGKK